METRRKHKERGKGRRTRATALGGVESCRAGSREGERNLCSRARAPVWGWLLGGSERCLGSFCSCAHLPALWAQGTRDDSSWGLLLPYIFPESRVLLNEDLLDAQSTHGTAEDLQELAVKGVRQELGAAQFGPEQCAVMRALWVYRAALVKPLQGCFDSWHVVISFGRFSSSKYGMFEGIKALIAVGGVWRPLASERRVGDLGEPV